MKALDQVGEAPFKRSLYQCQLAQALVMSQTHSVMRAKNWAPAYPQSSFEPGTAFTQNTHGIIVWMLNEICALSQFSNSQQPAASNQQRDACTHPPTTTCSPLLHTCQQVIGFTTHWTGVIFCRQPDPGPALCVLRIVHHCRADGRLGLPGVFTG